MVNQWIPSWSTVDTHFGWIVLVPVPQDHFPLLQLESLKNDVKIQGKEINKFPECDYCQVNE
jgi:hypothetical protein